MNFGTKYADKFKTARWIREGGLYILVCNFVTVLKYLMLQFLPRFFSSLPMVDFGWPGIQLTLFGESFRWNILGYDADHGGLPYFCAYMTAMILGECINFPIQKYWVFRSRGHFVMQIAWYAVAF